MMCIFILLLFPSTISSQQDTMSPRKLSARLEGQRRATISDVVFEEPAHEDAEHVVEYVTRVPISPERRKSGDILIDLNNPLTDLYLRSMRVYFKETHEDIARRVSPILSRSVKKQKMAVPIRYESDEKMALQMSPVIIDSLDQEIVRQSTELQNMAIENQRARMKFYMSLLGAIASLAGMVGAIVAHHSNCS